MEEFHTAISNGGSVVPWKDFQAAQDLSLQQDALRHSSSSAVNISLDNEELWGKFHSITNEMIVTRAGRCVRIPQPALVLMLYILLVG